MCMSHVVPDLPGTFVFVIDTCRGEQGDTAAAAAEIVNQLAGNLEGAHFVQRFDDSNSSS